MTGAPLGFPVVERKQLAGWGRTAPAVSDVSHPVATEDVVSLLSKADGRGVIARGLGRSYGDAAQRAGGLVLDMTSCNVIRDVDPTTGLITVDAGASLDAIMRNVLPQGWFVAVTAGTRMITVGGAIAADIHGKNHHRDGSFCHHVTAMTLVTPVGVMEITPESDPELFWATAGGMGLTGVVTRATLQLQPVESSWVMVDTHRFATLPDLMHEMETTDDDHHYSVAWVDCNAGGKRRGRSILTRGAHAARAQVASHPSKSAHQALSAPRLRVPLPAPKGLLNMASVAAFNELWFRRAPQERLGELQHLGTFFHPLDGVADWNLLYGRSGFLQYQFVVDDAHGAAVEQAIDLVAAAKAPSFLAVLKRFGPGNPGPLSFPMAGWTLALDFPVGPSALTGLVESLDVLIGAAGGRLYLAKDSRAHPERIHAMYPRLGELQAVRERIDPQRVLQSDLSRRLHL